MYRGGDWVPADKATVWTTCGGVNGAFGMVGKKDIVVEAVTIDPVNLRWSIR